jgi:hypothetical protein
MSLKSTDKTESLAHVYFYAKSFVIKKGYFDEIEWQDALCFEQVTESNFLKEVAWVILSGGMNENVIRGVFPALSKAFYNFESSYQIMKNREKCLIKGIRYFNNPGKLNAIIEIAHQIDLLGFDLFVDKIKTLGVDFIKKLPYLGPVTSYHLAKNLGINIAKPDRHLVRIAANMGFGCPIEMCEELANLIQEKISVIDIVFWRFANINRDYLNQFSEERIYC